MEIKQHEDDIIKEGRQVQADTMSIIAFRRPDLDHHITLGILISWSRGPVDEEQISLVTCSVKLRNFTVFVELDMGTTE
jgi:hypothetical protein